MSTLVFAILFPFFVVSIGFLLRLGWEIAPLVWPGLSELQFTHVFKGDVVITRNPDDGGAE